MYLDTHDSARGHPSMLSERESTFTFWNLLSLSRCLLSRHVADLIRGQMVGFSVKYQSGCSDRICRLQKVTNPWEEKNCCLLALIAMQHCIDSEIHIDPWKKHYIKIHFVKAISPFIVYIVQLIRLSHGDCDFVYCKSKRTNDKSYWYYCTRHQ